MRVSSAIDLQMGTHDADVRGWPLVRHLARFDAGVRGIEAWSQSSGRIVNAAIGAAFCKAISHHAAWPGARGRKPMTVQSRMQQNRSVFAIEAFCYWANSNGAFVGTSGYP
jgi:hypothetical protein